MNKIRLIAIEGLDGTGKTLQAKRLAQAMGVEYHKGGGWDKDSELARRYAREGNRDLYFSLMQRRFVRGIKEMLEQKKEGIVGVADRLVLVDVAHHLSFFFDPESTSFPEEERKIALSYLKKHIPEGTFGIVLDVSDPAILEQRIKQKKEFDLTEQDTLDRFEAKRAAWLWCADALGWEIVDATGSEEEVFKKIRACLEKNRVLPEGQVGLKEVKY
jgi:thymidylate kinase